VAARGEIGREGCEISSLVAGPSPRFSSRGAKNQTEEQKIRRGGHIFKIQYWMYAATGGAKREMGGKQFQMGGRAPLPPRWRQPCLVEHMELCPGCFHI